MTSALGGKGPDTFYGFLGEGGRGLPAAEYKSLFVAVSGALPRTHTKSSRPAALLYSA